MSKNFWNRYAKFYDYAINKYSYKSYNQMYELMSNTLQNNMNVLEVATGTGLIAINISKFVNNIQATDFSPKMIETAKNKVVPNNITFSIEDATNLSFADETFDVVIISNALHIMPMPQLALANIYRVLKPNGILIAPTFSHSNIKNMKYKILKLLGMESTKWTIEQYVSFINDNNFCVKRTEILKSTFPLMYVEAEKKHPV